MIKVSPINEHLVFEGHPWWERYQPISYKIKTRSGNKAQFLDMSKRCNAAGVRVYVDVILNHMAGENPPPVVGTANSTADPEKYRYPAVPYRKEHFNKQCDIDDWSNATELRDCEVSGLRDLNHTQEYVREKLSTFLNKLVDLGVAGFRVDSARYMWPRHIRAILAEVKDLNTDFGFPAGSRPFLLLEIADFGSGRGEVGRWDYQHTGRMTDFLIPGELGRAFRGYNNLKFLRNWGPQWNFLPSVLAVVFVCDHEYQRGFSVGGQDTLTYREYKWYKMASAFILAHPYAVPRVFSGYHYEDVNQGPPQDENGEILSPDIEARMGCSNSWICEHRWQAIAMLVGLRNEAHGTYLNNWWDNNSKQIAFSRGEKALIAWNGQKTDFDSIIQTCLPAGTYCDVVTGERRGSKCVGKSVVVNEEGFARVFIEADSEDGVFAIHTGTASSLRYVLSFIFHKVDIERMLTSIYSNSCPRKSLKKLLSMFWTTTCYKNSKVHIQLGKL